MDHTPTPTQPGDVTTDHRHIVLRTRIGAHYPADLQRTLVEDRIADAIANTITALGGTLDILQVGLAARPDWNEFGPVNRVTGTPLWKPGNNDPTD